MKDFPDTFAYFVYKAVSIHCKHKEELELNVRDIIAKKQSIPNNLIVEFTSQR